MVIRTERGEVMEIRCSMMGWWWYWEGLEAFVRRVLIEALGILLGSTVMVMEGI